MQEFSVFTFTEIRDLAELGLDLAEWLKRLTASSKVSQLSRIQSQHPPTQLNMRRGR
jgi:hypothetical protein